MFATIKTENDEAAAMIEEYRKLGGQLSLLYNPGADVIFSIERARPCSHVIIWPRDKFEQEVLCPLRTQVTTKRGKKK